MGSPQEEACPVAACQGGRTVGDRPAGADLPEGRMAGGACPGGGPDAAGGPPAEHSIQPDLAGRDTLLR